MSSGNGILPPPSNHTAKNAASVSAASVEASRLMPPPPPPAAGRGSGSGGGRGVGRPPAGGSGRGRGSGKRGPGRPPNSDRQGPPLGSGSSSGRSSTSEIRRGPGRPPGKRKKLASKNSNGSSTTTTAKSNNSTTKTAVAPPKKAKRKYTKRKPTATEESDNDDEEDDDDDELMEEGSVMDYDLESPTGKSTGYETDPETALDISEGKVSTVHWDPTEGTKVGWKVRLLSDSTVQDGRIVQYDPYTHKHKIFLETGLDEDPFEAIVALQKKKRKHQKSKFTWLRLPHTDAQVATRLVWAHVKGYAWWPAMEMELSSPGTSALTSPREGYVFVHFIGAPEVATLRDSPDCIRLFSQLVRDPVIEKSKKKRNAKAIAQAQLEELQLQHYKNQAARHMARKAFVMADHPATGSGGARYIGKRIKLFSSDINYPDGATVMGTVRQYSSVQKKWLVSFEVTHKMKHKMSAAWINLQSKDCSLTVLQNDSDKKGRKTDIVDPVDTDLVPYLFGFEA